ncbi:MAG: prepilin-type N-terminal cleavage/methylation domain-containing protein [Terriglobales bacterium]
MTRTTSVCRRDSSERRRNGFSLVELIVAMGIFMLISGFALTLFRDQQIASQGLAGQVGLNLSLRNAVAQMQMDLANAGSGYYQNLNMPSWPVGVTIVNNVVPQGGACNDAGAFTYGAACFDQVNIISGVDPNVTPPINATGPGNCSDTSLGNAYGQAAVFPNGHVASLAETAALFHRGDQLLLVAVAGTQQLTSVVLKQDPVVSNGMVRFTFNATNPDGTNPRANDPLDITTCEGHTPCSLPKMTKQFCTNDWIMKIWATSYKVDLSDPTDPKLTRQVGSNNPETVMEQVVGFKIGATLWNNGQAQFADLGEYVYDASAYCNTACTDPPTSPGDMAYNFTLVRSVRVSLIGRTVPDWRGTYIYRNGFDNGPYEVQGVAVVVNPRNMSMND